MTTVSLSADASVTEGENITYTATLTKSCGWRGDGHAKQWCNDHYR
ncbi:immunoglobulin-like domain-containing protein [Vibrio sp. ED004]